MAAIKVIIRTADKTRKAEVSLDSGTTGADVIQASVDQWALPSDTDYTLVSSDTGKVIAPASSLADGGIKNGDVLEVQPVLVAG